MKTIFLWLVLCDPSGAQCEAFQLDSFEGPDAKTDCSDRVEQSAAALALAGVRGWRVGCKTEAEFLGNKKVAM